MKALIAIILVFLCAVAHTYAREIGGVLGWCLTMAAAVACILIGKALWKMWDEHKEKKQKPDK